MSDRDDRAVVIAVVVGKAFDPVPLELIERWAAQIVGEDADLVAALGGAEIVIRRAPKRRRR